MECIVAVRVCTLQLERISLTHLRRCHQEDRQAILIRHVIPHIHNNGNEHIASFPLTFLVTGGGVTNTWNYVYAVIGQLVDNPGEIRDLWGEACDRMDSPQAGKYVYSNEIGTSKGENNLALNPYT